MCNAHQFRKQRQPYPIVKAVQKHFSKRLRFVFRNFPLTQIHPQAESAAETAEFAGAHAHFWEMHDGLYENQDALGPAAYLALAKDLGLPEKALSEALEKHTFKPRVGQRLHGRPEERRERHTDVLHQREAARRGLRF